jgi:hypothetical protein
MAILALTFMRWTPWSPEWSQAASSLRGWKRHHRPAASAPISSSTTYKYDTWNRLELLAARTGGAMTERRILFVVPSPFLRPDYQPRDLASLRLIASMLFLLRQTIFVTLSPQAVVIRARELWP